MSPKTMVTMRLDPALLERIEGNRTALVETLLTAYVERRLVIVPWPLPAEGPALVCMNPK